MPEITDAMAWAAEIARERCLFGGNSFVTLHGMEATRTAIAAVYPLIFEAGRRQGLEEAAKKLDLLGVGNCERGSVDYTTGVFECRRLECGDCNCSGFDEVAEAIRALKQKEQPDV